MSPEAPTPQTSSSSQSKSRTSTSTSTSKDPTLSSSLTSPLPVPTHGPGGTFSVLAKTRIAAPPIVVLNAIRDTAGWEKWNSFCPRCVLEPDKDSGLARPSGTGAGGQLEVGEGKLPTGEAWLELGSVADIDVYMAGDGLVPDRKRSRGQGIVVTVLERINEADSSSTASSSAATTPTNASASSGTASGTEAGQRKGWRIAWKSTGWSHWQLHSERVMEFVEIEGGKETEYACWETFGGVLGKVVKATVGSVLVERFGEYAADVKGFVEGAKKGKEGLA